MLIIIKQQLTNNLCFYIWFSLFQCCLFADDTQFCEFMES